MIIGELGLSVLEPKKSVTGLHIVATYHQPILDN